MRDVAKVHSISFLALVKTGGAGWCRQWDSLDGDIVQTSVLMANLESLLVFTLSIKFTRVRADDHGWLLMRVTRQDHSRAHEDLGSCLAGWLLLRT